jgi:hypothetical protein
MNDFLVPTLARLIFGFVVLVFPFQASFGLCTPIPSGGVGWDTHQCGAGGANCADSEVPPFPPPAPGTVFANLTNKMAACCGRGWVENPNEAQKMDCVESVAPPATSPPTKTFLTFYMEGNAPDDLLTAGLTYPNQLFLLDSTGLPLNGFYTQSGVRCGYRDIVTKAPLQLSAQDQLGLFRTAIGNLRVPVMTQKYRWLWYQMSFDQTRRDSRHGRK